MNRPFKWSFPKLSLPWKPGAAAASAALVIRADEVELVWMQGKTIGGHTQVALATTTPEALTQAVRHVMSEAQLKSSQVSVSIASVDVLVRFFMLPFLSKAERDTAVQFEARKYVPFKIDSLAWDYSMVSPESAVVSGEGSQGPLEVVFSAIPLDVLNRFRSALLSAGVHPVSVEPLSQSLARLTATVNGRTPHVFDCVLEVRRDQAHLVIARYGMPHLTRDIQGDAAADAFGQRLLSELSVSMDFFKREYPSAVFSRIWLVGEGETVARYQRELSGGLPCPVESGTALLSEMERTLQLSSAAAVSVLRQGAAPRTERSLNLLRRSASMAAVPEREPIAVPTAVALKELAKHPVTIRTALITAAGLSLVLWVAGNIEVSRVRHRLEAVKQAREADRYGLSVMARDALTSAQQKSHEQLQLLKSLMEQRPQMAQKLDALARSLPEGMWLTGITFEDKLNVSGGAAAGKNKSARQAKLVVNGACFLGMAGGELKAIQEFEARVKNNPQLQYGLGQVRMGKVDAASSNAQETQQPYSYKTFQLSCQSSSGRL